MKRKPKRKYRREISCRHCKRGFVELDRRKKTHVCPFCHCTTRDRKSLKSMKAEAWRSCSRYIRLRDSDKNGICACVTCGSRHPWDSRDMQAGHFLDSRSRGILFDERCIHAQCRSCNIFKNGNKDAYWPFMLKKYGRVVIDELIRNKNTAIGSWTMDELQDIADEFDRKTTELLAGRG